MQKCRCVDYLCGLEFIHLYHQTDIQMKEKKSYSKTFVVKNTSTALVDFFNKLRDHKMSKIEELRSKKDIYFTASTSK